jgi:hypothetical protein
MSESGGNDGANDDAMTSDYSECIEPDERGDCCPICSEDMRSPCRTACGHMFCSSCLVRSFEMKRPRNRGPCPMCRTAASVYTTISIQTGESLVVPEFTSIFGGVYLQGGREGVASYVTTCVAYCCFLHHPLSLKEHLE